MPSNAERLAKILYQFNAKERDALMRFALLGETSKVWSSDRKWVNDGFLSSLKEALGWSGDDKSKCVFAGMDYHLDWLHAALWQHSHGTGAPTSAPQPNVAHPKSCDDETGRTRYDIMGDHEDVDLLLVIEHDDATHVVLVEAKGVSSFGRKQLDSKLSRLRVTLESSHVQRIDNLHFALVLTAPGLPDATTFREYAEHNNPKKTKYPALKEPTSRIGDTIRKMPMPNFPLNLLLVTRCTQSGAAPKTAAADDLEKDGYWKIKPRQKGRSEPKSW